MEATAVSVGKAVLDGALSYASSKAAKEIVLQLGVNRDVEFITEELQMMQSFLMTADEEQSQNKVLTTWVKQIRDLAYKVEDSLMDLGLCLEMKPSWGCIPFSPCDRRRIAMEVKELRAKVEEVSSRNLRYRLIKESSNAKPVALEEQARIVSASMFGINANFEQEKPKVDLHQLIHSNDVDLRVISVWGSSGDLGKTSAIQEAYDDPRVIKKFGFCAWIRLMHPFNAQEFLQSLVRQFYESSHDEVEKQGNERSVGANVLAKMEKMDQSDLVREFDANLCSNSYLIVINDLSTIEEWHCIKKYFPDNKKQSRIIVSTQQVEIASLCAEKPYQASELKQLSCDQTIYLFHKKNLEEQVTMPSANATMLETSEATRAAMEKEKMKAMHASCSAKSISSSNKVTSTEENTAMPSSEIQEDQQPKSADEDKICNSTARNKFDRSRTLVLVDELLTGRETEKSIVIKLVCQPENNQGCNVISVWGMGGLGKTTLVRSVYRSQELSSLKRAWSTAMRPFNPEVLLRDLALQLQKSIQEDPAGATAAGAQTKSITVMKLKELKEELSRLLNIQKCLIVLDDISSASEWELVKSSLYNAGRIIVTTREKNIAEYCSGGYRNMYNLEGLKDDDALDLFKKKVFKHNIATNVFVPAMMEQARLILKKCDGLPLAISAIGGFLATKPKTAIEWRKMNDHISAELEINPELRTIKTVLMRSYDGLPYHLKSAFLYMSIFREDRIIRRNRLVRRWMAEGYSREMHGMTAAEVGNNYFDELLDRSMILPGEGVDYFNEKIDACQLHDIIHEICISKAREENLVFTLEEGCRLRSTQDAIRHLVIGSNWRRDKDLLESMLDLSHVRSLTVYGEWESFFISDNMRFLRVLDLEDTLGLRDHHLEKIGQLLHLKYLSLRGCQNIYYLPNSFGNLRQLQTLDVRGTRIFELPTTITKLRKLQHLRTTDDYSKKRDHLMGEHNIIGKYASRVTASSSSVALLVQAAPLFWRPQVLDDDLNRHDILNIYRFLMVCLEEKGTIYGWLEGVEAPRGIGKLKALHTLDLVNVARGKGKATLKELGGLTQLYKLGVAGISNENSKEFWSAIAGHNQLRSLSVQGYPWRELDGCLGEGLSPPSCIKSLKLYGELVRVTEWIHQLQNLSKLILAYTHLEHNAAVQVLGGLPSLAVLRLMWGSFVGEQLHFHGPSFPNLVVLELNGLIGVDSVVFEENTMPKLELLQADWCCSLKEISGLPLLTSLKGVRLGYQISQELKEQVQSQVAEYLKHISLDTNYVSSFSME